MSISWNNEEKVSRFEVRICAWLWRSAIGLASLGARAHVGMLMNKIVPFIFKGANKILVISRGFLGHHKLFENQY